MKTTLSVLLLSAFLLLSCSKSSDTTSANNGGDNNNGTNQIIATVGGKQITFNAYTHSGSIASFVFVGKDSASGKTMSLGGGGAISTGTYDIGINSVSPIYAFALSYTYPDSTGQQVTYESDASDGVKCGSITISSWTSSGIKGTFTATLPFNGGPYGAPATVSIANASFNIVF